MKKISKNILICILSAMMFFSSVASSYITVYATEEDDVTHGGGGHSDKPDYTWAKKLDDFMNNVTNFSAFLLCQGVAISEGDYVQYTENFRERLKDNFFYDDGTVNTDNVTYDESTDSITMDVSSMINTIAGQMGLVIVPANVNVSSQHDNVMSLFAGNKNYVYQAYNTRVYYCDLDSYYIIPYSYSGGSVSMFYAYNKETLEEDNTAVTQYYYNTGFSGPVYSISTSAELVFKLSELRDNVSFAYWSNMTMLKRFLNGSTYLGSSFGQSSTITIPVSDLAKDWESAYNTIAKQLNEIRETTGERPTQQQIDDVFKDVLGKLEDIGGDIGDIGGDVEEVAKTLDDIYKILEKWDTNIDTSKLEEVLEEIRNMIADSGNVSSEDLSGLNEVLSAIQAVLIEIKNGMSAQNDYSDALNDIYDLLEKMYKVQKLGIALDVADVLLDIADLLDDGDTSFLDKMGTSLANVANASKEHYPTSIPWDLIAIFKVFDAEAVAPSYDIPFSIPGLGIEETVNIDLSGFEQASKVSRTYLSVLFLLLLIHLTRKLTMPDAGEE